MNIDEMKKENEIIKEAAAAVSTEPEQLLDVIQKLQKEIKDFDNSIKELK